MLRAVATSSGVGLSTRGAAASPTAANRAKKPSATIGVGEPYEPLGRRIVFTNWYWIRPGTVRWLDKKGKRPGIGESVGPLELDFRPLDSPSGVELRLQPAERIGPLVEADKPWEDGSGVCITTVFRDGGIFRGWGSPMTTSGPPPGHRFFYYLESHDGLTWRRPNLGIFNFQGSRANNILGPKLPTANIFIDPSAPAAERYKLVRMGIEGGISQDGLHWKMLPKPIVEDYSDTQQVGYYDVRLRKYVIYTRRWSVGPRSPRVPPDARRSWSTVGRRSIGRTEGEDFRKLPVPETILEPGLDFLPSDGLYTNCRTSIPGALDHHLMFPTLWHMRDDTTSVILASSHDGKLWHYVPGPAVLTTGPFGAWDGGCVFAHPNLLELSDGSFVLPYTGYNFPHKYPRGQFKFAPGYAVWPKGRLVALEALERGEFATVSILSPGRRLRLNVRTRRGGSVLVSPSGMGETPRL